MATERYTERIGVRATPEEKRVIEERAERAGLSKSRYLAKAGTAAASASELEGLHHQLTRGADRINDLVREMQEGADASPEHIEDVAARLRQAASKVMEVL